MKSTHQTSCLTKVKYTTVLSCVADHRGSKIISAVLYKWRSSHTVLEPPTLSMEAADYKCIVNAITKRRIGGRVTANNKDLKGPPVNDIDRR